ncbi:MAG: hypothetical protein ACLRWP_13795 [Bilophila wadsworthia]
MFGGARHLPPASGFSTAPGKPKPTQSHEAIASIVPAVDFIAGLGTGSTRRERLVSGFERIERHENALAGIIRQGLTDVPGLKLYQSEGPKTATVAFTLEGQQPGHVCRKLCDRYGIFAADGDYYAETLAHRVGETGSAAGSGSDSRRATPKRELLASRPRNSG